MLRRLTGCGGGLKQGVREKTKTPRVSSRFPAGPVGRKGLPFAETGRGLGSGVRS